MESSFLLESIPQNIVDDDQIDVTAAKKKENRNEKNYLSLSWS